MMTAAPSRLDRQNDWPTRRTARAIVSRHLALRPTSASSLAYYDIETGSYTEQPSTKTLALSTEMCYSLCEVYEMIQQHPYTKSLTVR